MKTTRKLLLIAEISAVLALNVNVRADDFFGAATKASALVHRPVAASPHALEEFSWLLRPGLNEKGAPARSESVPACVRKNKAYVKSPRVLEEYPELQRRGEDASGVSPNGGKLFAGPPDVLKNKAFARSPRVLEIYPWLANPEWHSLKPDQIVTNKRL